MLKYLLAFFSMSFGEYQALKNAGQGVYKLQEVHMKKIAAIVCCLALLLSLGTMNASATELQQKNDVVTSERIDNLRVQTQGLWYRENLYFDYVVSTTVTPESGAALNVWLNNTLGPVTVTVYKTNILGLYSQVYNNTFQVGERDVNVVSSCNGSQYLVKFTAATGGSIMSALIYQH